MVTESTSFVEYEYEETIDISVSNEFSIPKSQVLEKTLVNTKNDNYEIDSILFTILSSDEIIKYSETQINAKELYEPMTYTPMSSGVLDCKLGVNKNEGVCSTCGKGFQECSGHWGHISLYNPVFHIGYFKHLINLLYCICKRCARLLINEKEKKKLIIRMRQCEDPIIKRFLLKQIVDKCKKENVCLNPDCQAPQGVLRRLMKSSLDQFMKIIQQKKIQHKTKGATKQSVKILNEDLDPRYIYSLLKRISPLDLEILNVDSPDKFIISNLLVPPKCIRPSIILGDTGTNEDDLTIIFSEIVDINNIIKNQTQAGLQSSSVLGNWEYLQLQCTRFINSETPSVQALLATKNISSSGRGICQRLKGKEGRFRGNLSGKRVDFSGRTVISPDADCPIDEVIIPVWSAKRLTFPETVSGLSMKSLRNAILRGPDEWPGAAFVIKKNGNKCSLQFANRRIVAENLQIGDIVERHLWNGDIVLFNRQPSLHRLSIMAHRVRVMPWRTFRFNECVCAPYNADFDGDEMNCHLPQTYEARAEAYHLMGVVQNLLTPKNGDPLIAATQDFLCGAYLLTSRDTFFTRDQFALLCCYFTDSLLQIDLPPPTIIKPIELWTGKQIINVLLRPNKSASSVIVSFELAEREFTRPQNNEPSFMCPNDGYVLFVNSEHLCGALGKVALGNCSKKSLFYHLIKEVSPQTAAIMMGRLAKLTGRWLSNRGMTIGIDDVTPNDELIQQKQILLEKGYKDVNQAIEAYNNNTMQPHSGSTLEETLELKVKSILDDLRNLAGKASQKTLTTVNKPLIMYLSGAKGSLINIAQMIALVGQQNVCGQRIQNGFVGRTLPHFQIHSQDAKSHGFVAHSFYDGLEPEEFFFHTMSGREGLVDTAVKTAETGYMQRRLVKALEDLSIRYDGTVRTSDGQIVQLVYGDDGLTPGYIEANNISTFFDTLFTYIMTLPHIPPTDIEEKKRYRSICQCVHHLKKKCNNQHILPPTDEEMVSLRLFLTNQLDQYIRTSASDKSSVVNDPAETQKQSPSVDQLTSTTSITPTISINSIDIDQYDINKRKRKKISLKKKKIDNTELFMSESNIFSDSENALILPKQIKKKINVLKSWNQSRNLNKSGSIENDYMYIQAKNNVLAYLIVNLWLCKKKRYACLLPYEIQKWTEFLIPLVAEPIPELLRDHQQLCLREKPTHQKETNQIYIFDQMVQDWLDNKNKEIMAYRSENLLHSGYDYDSYIECLNLIKKNPANITKKVIKSKNGEGQYCRNSLSSDPLIRRNWVFLNDPECNKSSSSENSRIKHEIELSSPVLQSNVTEIDLSANETKLNLTDIDRNLEDPKLKTKKSKLKSKKLEFIENEIDPNEKNSHQAEEASSSHSSSNTSVNSGTMKNSVFFEMNPKYVTSVWTLLEFLRLAWKKYSKSLIEPGEPVGAIGAQSIGEPGTQMTLKTFHFAGVASMNVTLGVPRIKEIINASTKIITPIIQVPLVNSVDIDYAIMVKNTIEKTLLGEVCKYIKQVFSPTKAYIEIKLDANTIAKNFLNITAEIVRHKILNSSCLLGNRLKLKEEYIQITSPTKLSIFLPNSEHQFFDLHILRKSLVNVCLSGLNDIKRGVLKREENTNPETKDKQQYIYSLAVEGYGLLDVMGVRGVVGTRCTSNHIMEVKNILGIEAARRTIIDEIRVCMEAYSMNIDSRHMQLLADVMTFRGDVLGISRFGIQKMRASTLMLASFEETNEHLFEAAAHQKIDKIDGVSECIIMGKPVSLGTGSFSLLFDHKKIDDSVIKLQNTNSPYTLDFKCKQRPTSILSKLATRIKSQ